MNVSLKKLCTNHATNGKIWENVKIMMKLHH